MAYLDYIQADTARKQQMMDKWRAERKAKEEASKFNPATLGVGAIAGIMSGGLTLPAVLGGAAMSGAGEALRSSTGSDVDYASMAAKLPAALEDLKTKEAARGRSASIQPKIEEGLEAGTLKSDYKYDPATSLYSESYSTKDKPDILEILKSLEDAGIDTKSLLTGYDPRSGKLSFGDEPKAASSATKAKTATEKLNDYMSKDKRAARRISRARASGATDEEIAKKLGL